MDALALLCTLHADGPSTLRELRFAGCHDLLDLVASDPQALSECLNLTLSAANRLQREARLLGSRMQLLEPEDHLIEVELEDAEATIEVEPQVEQEVALVVAPRVVKPLPPSMRSSSANRSWFNATRIPLACTQRQSQANDLEIRIVPVPVETRAVETQTIETEVVETVASEVVVIEPIEIEETSIDTPIEVVLETTAQDENTLPETHSIDLEPALESRKPENEAIQEPSQVINEAAEVRKQHWPLVDEELVADNVETPASPAENPFMPLEVGLIAGLDADVLQLLASADIRSIESLVLASGLDLSRKLSIPFTRLLELQLGAQHLVRNPLTEKPEIAEVVEASTTQETAEPSVTLSPAQRRRHTDTYTKQTFPLPSKVDTPPFDQSLADLSGSVGGPFA
ncbi:MAG: hypothetical protein ACI8TQ_001479 [Planctomycetota bacterium]|jgi:hypothetical protein